MGVRLISLALMTSPAEPVSSTHSCLLIKVCILGLALNHIFTVSFDERGFTPHIIMHGKYAAGASSSLV